MFAAAQTKRNKTNLVLVQKRVWRDPALLLLDHTLRVYDLGVYTGPLDLERRRGRRGR